MPRGGKRPNAGRPPGSRNKVPAGAREIFKRFLDLNLDEILDELGRTKDPRVRLEVVRLAAAYALGRPREAIDISHSVNPFQDFLERRALEAVTVESEPVRQLPAVEEPTS